jgi:aminoglycoside phosphotransferase family enzyme
MNGRARLAEVVAALRQPACYPEPVACVEAIETHMSWVFLVERYAYKLKKPIITPLLDFSTIGARRVACEEELRLNRRLAASVYLAVVPLVRTEREWRLEGEGHALDWLVKMRRLPRERMLDACIERSTIRPVEVERLAHVLSAFYASAARVPITGAAYREQLSLDIAAKRATLLDPRYALPPAEIEALVAKLWASLERHGASLEGRAASVVEAHGDLRPEHICLEAEPVAIDCLEFDRSLRLLDPLSELSFLALECRRLAAAWVGERLIERYEDESGVAAPRALRSFYASYHALVRAAVAIWHLDDVGLEHMDRFRARALEYLRLGREQSP